MQTLTTGEWVGRGLKLLMLVLLPLGTAVMLVSWEMRDPAAASSPLRLAGATVALSLILALPVLAAGMVYLTAVLVLAEFLPGGGPGLPVMCASAFAVGLLFWMAVAAPAYLTHSNPATAWVIVVTLLGLAGLAGPVRGWKEGTAAVERDG